MPAISDVDSAIGVVRASPKSPLAEKNGLCESEFSNDIGVSQDYEPTESGQPQRYNSQEDLFGQTNHVLIKMIPLIV